MAHLECSHKPHRNTFGTDDYKVQHIIDYRRLLAIVTLYPKAQREPPLGTRPRVPHSRAQWIWYIIYGVELTALEHMIGQTPEVEGWNTPSPHTLLASYPIRSYYCIPLHSLVLCCDPSCWVCCGLVSPWHSSASVLCSSYRIVQ